MMRVGVLLGGLEHVSEIAIPPAQRLRVVDLGGEMKPTDDLRRCCALRSIPH